MAYERHTCHMRDTRARRARSAVLVRLVLAVLLMAAGVAGNAAAPGGDFTLTRADGRPFSLRELRGRVVVLSFGYTSCPDVCPTTLANVSALMRSLGPRSGEVVPLFISVDPRRDTPKRLGEYLAWFHPAIIGLTGSEAQLRRIAKQYGTFFTYQGDTEAGDYEVNHSGSLYLIDRDGKLARIVPYGMPPSQLVESVEALIGPEAAE